MDIPIVSLDKLFILPDDKDIFYLDCTRISGSNDIKSRKNINIDEQIQNILSKLWLDEIIIADDVIFSGTVLRDIIKRFSKYGIKVVGAISSICSMEGYEYFNKSLKYGISCNYLMSSNVIDQICERDFYFGIAGSGIVVNTNDGFYKAPYFKPYGDPCVRASIPKYAEKEFSKGCLRRSIALWEEICRLKGNDVLIGELPEEIINTKKEESVVKTLKKEFKRL